MTDLKTEVMTAKLYFNAVFPSLQVFLDDDQEYHNAFYDVQKTFQFGTMYRGDLMCCTIHLSDCKITVTNGPADDPDVSMTFNSVWKMNEYLRGGLVIPKVSGSAADKKLLNSLVSGVKLLYKSDSKLKDDEDKALKAKFALYSINRGLSKLNKLEDPDMQEFCADQPDNIYRIAVNHGRPDFISCFLRICMGNTRAGHGNYDRLSPFVEFVFDSINDLLDVLSGKYSLVESVEYEFATFYGEPEFGERYSDFFETVRSMIM